MFLIPTVRSASIHVDPHVARPTDDWNCDSFLMERLAAVSGLTLIMAEDGCGLSLPAVAAAGLSSADRLPDRRTDGSGLPEDKSRI